MRWTLERAGPAFIKWGQWSATRPDLFPPDICRELAKLHTRAPQHSFAATRRIVEAALGAKLADVFVAFHPVPVASGSIAQARPTRGPHRPVDRVLQPQALPWVARPLPVLPAP